MVIQHRAVLVQGQTQSRSRPFSPAFGVEWAGGHRTLMTLTTAVTVVREATARVEHTEEETESGKLW